VALLRRNGKHGALMGGAVFVSGTELFHLQHLVENEAEAQPMRENMQKPYLAAASESAHFKIGKYYGASSPRLHGVLKEHQWLRSPRCGLSCCVIQPAVSRRTFFWRTA